MYKHAQIPTIAGRGIVVLTNTTKQYPVNSLGDLVGTPETNFVCFSISDKPSELYGKYLYFVQKSENAVQS